MKKLMCALLALAMLCALLVVASAETETDFIDMSGLWACPESDRAELRIMRTFEVDAKDDEVWYDVQLTWPDSLASQTVWYMLAQYDRETQSLTYTDGVKAEVTFAEDGSIANEEKLWEDSEGALIPIDGKIMWADKREDQLRAEAGEENLFFQRIPRTAPDADDFLSEYFTKVANVEDGTAGASLKQAEVARDIVQFAASNRLWNANMKRMRGNMLKAWESMSDEDHTSFDGNLQDIFMPLLESAFGNYPEVEDTFNDAGVGEEMSTLCDDKEAEDSWQTLLGNTMTLGNDDDMFAYAEDGRFIVQISAPAYGEGEWTAELQDDSVVRVASEKVENGYYNAVYEPVDDGEMAVSVRHMDGIACVEYYSMVLTVRDGAIQDPSDVDYHSADVSDEQYEALLGNWEDPTGMAVAEFKPANKGYDVEITIADASGAHVWTMTVQYDCELDAWVYDNGARYATAISDSDDTELGEPEYTDHGGKLYFVPDENGNPVLHWFENDDEDDKPVTFTHVE